MVKERTTERGGGEAPNDDLHLVKKKKILI